MDFEIYSFRHAETILKSDFNLQYEEVLQIIRSIDDNLIKKTFGEVGTKSKSLSTTLNNLLKYKFQEKGWTKEAKIFNNSEFKDQTWRLDFAKDDISLEVGFNHGTVATWNLIKPTIAGELNHVEKEITTKVGVVITAMKDLKTAGGFDGAIGTFESYKKYIRALNNVLTIPILLIGLKAPTTFKISHEKNPAGKNIGKIVDLS